MTINLDDFKLLNKKLKEVNNKKPLMVSLLMPVGLYINDNILMNSFTKKLKSLTNNVRYGGTIYQNRNEKGSKKWQIAQMQQTL